VYDACRLYTVRDCYTCEMARLPKVSHCSVCNNCVRGFDHHCDILNNCIGIRNVRAFIMMTIFELIYAIGLAVIGGIYLIRQELRIEQ